VTGFGLVGHLVEMLKASGKGARLFLEKTPVMQGVRESIQAGIISSLQPENLRLSNAIENLDRASKHSDYPILFDPQTAGGLLASVPAAQAELCLSELRDMGYSSAVIIGETREGGASGSVRVEV
jgi:selenide,water dikinase